MNTHKCSIRIFVFFFCPFAEHDRKIKVRIYIIYITKVLFSTNLIFFSPFLVFVLRDEIKRSGDDFLREWTVQRDFVNSTAKLRNGIHLEYVDHRLRVV